MTDQMPVELVSQMNIALLIDGENIAARHYVALERSIHQIKQAALRRVYGDFSNPSHAAWLSVCKEYAVEPVLHLPVSIAKNGTDMAITIAAMDIMSSRQFDALFIASDDSDFLPLVRRLRNERMQVHGIGLKPATKAAEALYNSWTILASAAAYQPPSSQPTAASQVAPTNGTKPASDVNGAVASVAKSANLIAEFRKLVHGRLAEESSTLSSLGSWIRQDHPKFTTLLGPGKLKKLLDADTRFKVTGQTASLVK